MKIKMMSIMIGVLFMLPVFVMAQKSPTDELFEKYSGKEGFTTIHINKELFAMMSQINDSASGEVKDMKDAMEGLQFIKMLIIEDKEEVGDREFENFRNELKDFDLKGFSELMQIKESDEMIKFMVRKNGDKFQELLLLIDQPDEAGFISIYGNLDLEAMSKISKSMNIHGWEKLNKMNDDK